MKTITIVLLAMFILSGCAKKQLYVLPADKTQADFLVDREVCTAQSGYRDGGFFLFGPAILIFPVAITLEAINAKRQKTFQRCMSEKEWVCQNGCWNMHDI